MILRALHSAGYLDISSQELLQGELTVFRRTLVPGQTIEVPDEYRRFKNIHSAINAGQLEVVSYKSTADSVVVQEELDGLGGGLDSSTITLDSGETKTLDSVSILTERAAKWFISTTDGTNGTYGSTEIFAQHDGTTAISNEFGTLGSASVTFCVDVVGGEMRLRVEATEDGQIVKSKRISIET
jgi:hypothetical protein